MMSTLFFLGAAALAAGQSAAQSACADLADVMSAEQCLSAKADGCGQIAIIDENCAWTCADCTLAPTLAPTPAPTAPPIALNPKLRTDAGQLVLSTNEDVLINIYAVTGGGPAEASPGRQFALLEAMDTMAADISTLRDELSTEVGRAPFLRLRRCMPVLRVYFARPHVVNVVGR